MAKARTNHCKYLSLNTAKDQGHEQHPQFNKYILHVTNNYINNWLN